MAFENTQNKLDELRNLTWQNGKLIEQNQQLLDQLENGAGAIGSEIMTGKQSLVSAIEYKGGTSNADKSFQGIAEDIKEIPNFPTTDFEYISEIYRPRTLMEAYSNKTYLRTVVDNLIEELSGIGIFEHCSYLQSVQFPSLITISGDYTFRNTALSNVLFPSLITISGDYTFSNCSYLQSVQFPSLITISGIYTFSSCQELQSVQFGTLEICIDPFGNSSTRLRNITIGNNTNINLPFQNWRGTNVIAEGQTGIDELNSNLYNNLLTKLYDHSGDGQTRTLKLGWLAYVTQENIDYANSKGWTLTT
jgi:hypothetical protein